MDYGGDLHFAFELIGAEILGNVAAAESHVQGTFFAVLDPGLFSDVVTRRYVFMVFAEGYQFH